MYSQKEWNFWCVSKHSSSKGNKDVENFQTKLFAKLGHHIVTPLRYKAFKVKLTTCIYHEKNSSYWRWAGFHFTHGYEFTRYNYVDL